MSLFIATGTNLGNKKENLKLAKEILTQNFSFIAMSRIYTSSAVNYTEQPDFYNQVLEFKIPALPPEKIMFKLLELEKQMGRERIIAQGPRIIDMDILFIGDLKINSEHLILPHPRWFERSFVVLPLLELPGTEKLKQQFQFPLSFDNSASPISD